MVTSFSIVHSNGKHCFLVLFSAINRNGQSNFKTLSALIFGLENTVIVIVKSCASRNDNFHRPDAQILFQKKSGIFFGFQTFTDIPEPVTQIGDKRKQLISRLPANVIVIRSPYKLDIIQFMQIGAHTDCLRLRNRILTRQTHFSVRARTLHRKIPFFPLKTIRKKIMTIRGKRIFCIQRFCITKHLSDHFFTDFNMGCLAFNNRKDRVPVRTQDQKIRPVFPAGISITFHGYFRLHIPERRTQNPSKITDN